MNYLDKCPSCGSDSNRAWRNASEQERTAEIQKRKLFEAQCGLELKTARMKIGMLSATFGALMVLALLFWVFSRENPTFFFTAKDLILLPYALIGAFWGFVIGLAFKSRKEKLLWDDFGKTYADNF